MLPAWIVYVVSVTLLITIAALLAEGTLRQWGVQVRWVWFTAILAAQVFPIAAGEDGHAYVPELLSGGESFGFLDIYENEQQGPFCTLPVPRNMSVYVVYVRCVRICYQHRVPEWSVSGFVPAPDLVVL